MKLRPIRPSDAARLQRMVEEPAVRAVTNMPELGFRFQRLGSDKNPKRGEDDVFAYYSLERV